MLHPYKIHYMAAAVVTKFYLGTWFEDADNDPLLDVEPLQNTTRRYQLADALFTLRKEPAFEEICRRFSKLDLRAAFFESFAARHFRQHGFQIHSRPERQKLREDFDFSIRGPGVDANVEVTAFRDCVFNAASLRNSLNHKRGQLPDDKPAIIICVVPGTWRDSIPDFEDELRSLANGFLRGTQRINHLFIIEDIFIRKGDDGAGLTHILSYKNERPRRASSELDRAISSTPKEDAEVRHLLSTVWEARSTGELQAWIDWVMTRPSGVAGGGLPEIVPGVGDQS